MTASAAWRPHILWPHWFLSCRFKTSAISGTSTQQPRSLGLPQWGWLALGLELGLCLGASSLVMPGTLLWSNGSSMPFWALPSQRPRGSLAWPQPFPSSSPCEGAVSTSHSSFSRVLFLFLHLPRQLGESGWLRVWQKTNKYCINKKNKAVIKFICCR